MVDEKAYRIGSYCDCDYGDYPGNDIVILAMKCHIDHCHLFVNAPPTLSAAEIMKIIKGTTGRILKQEFFPDTVMQMWTRSYFVSTAGDVYTATIQHYVEQQKKRGG